MAPRRRAWWLAATAVALLGSSCTRSSGSESARKSGDESVREPGDVSCDAALQAANAEVRRERLALRPTALYLARHPSYGAADGRVLSACGAVPAYLREHLEYQAALIADQRGATPPEISAEAREQYRAEMKKRCGENGLAGQFPPERRAAEVGQRCGLPHPGMGVIIPLYHHLRSAGAKTQTAWSAIELSLSDPPALAFDEPPMLDRLPAGTCSEVIRDGIAARVSASGVEIATQAAVPIVDGGLEPKGRRRLQAWLREFTARDFHERDGWMSTKRLMIVADADAPALALTELADLSPDLEPWLLLRRSDVDASDPYAPHPITLLPLRGPGQGSGALRLLLESGRARLLSDTSDEVLAESSMLGPVLSSKLGFAALSGGVEYVDVLIGDPSVTVAAMVDVMQPMFSFCETMGMMVGEAGLVSWSVRRSDGAAP